MLVRTFSFDGLCAVCRNASVGHFPVCEKCRESLVRSHQQTIVSMQLSVGPGAELKKLLKRIGIEATPDCSCNARARKMDEMEAREPGWCEAHIDEIVGWLREEAAKRRLPFLDAAGRVLVRRAISNARKAEARRAQEAAEAEGKPAV